MKKFFFCLLLTVNFAQADSPHLEMMEQMEAYTQILDENEYSGEKSLAWDLIRVRTTLEIGVEIPLISKFSVKPEAEFYFSKK